MNPEQTTLSSRERRRLLVSLGDGEIVELDEEKGRAVLEFTAKEDFTQSGGVIQGGFVTGWIDCAMAHAVMAKSRRAQAPTTLEIKVSFLRGTPPGGRVRAEGWIERMGRSVAFVAGRLLDSSGNVLATGTSTAKLRPVTPRL